MPPVFLRPSAPSLLVKYTVLLYNIFNISPMCKKQRQFALSGLINNLNEVHTMNRTSLRRLCIAALLCAACTLMTAFLSVPTFITTVGNINLGDCVTLCACLLLGLWYGPAVGALGGALADLLSGYTVYAPATLAAKFLMGLIACLILRPRKNAGFPGFWRSVLALLAGGVAMVLCYFLYEWLLLRYRRCGHQCSVQHDTACA